MSILVTGGSGFIGSHLVDLFIDKGFCVFVVDKETPQYPNNKAQYIQLNISSNNLEKVFKDNKIDYVIHLAAQASVSISVSDPEIDAQNNILATINLLTLCKKYNVKKIIAASTAAVYGNPEYLPVDERHPVNFLSPYALSKYAMEEYIKLSGVDYIIFRYSNVYGPRQNSKGEAGVISIFTDKMINNEKIEIHGDGEQVRDFIFVEDIAKINLIAITSDIKNKVMNFSSNTGKTINQLFDAIQNNTKYKLEPANAPPRTGDIRLSILNNKKAVELLGYAPKIDFETGIKLTTEFFKRKGNING